MSESVYKIVELVVISPNTWEKVAKNAVKKTDDSLRNLRISEISTLDMKIENGKVSAYLSRVKLSFKYDS